MDHDREQEFLKVLQVFPDDALTRFGLGNLYRDAGRLEDASGLYGSKAYRELLDRRADGAQDKDLVDLVDDFSAEINGASGSETAGAVLFSHQMENRLAA